MSKTHEPSRKAEQKSKAKHSQRQWCFKNETQPHHDSKPFLYRPEKELQKEGRTKEWIEEMPKRRVFQEPKTYYPEISVKYAFSLSFYPIFQA